jgi:hypothetical protein
MENDSIRASGNDTLVDMWINGKLRAISISRDAIASYIGSDRAASMSEGDRCEFIRTHLPLVVSAVRAKLRDSNPSAESVVIEAGELGGGGDRRKADRRKGDRRETNRPKRPLPHGERRRAERRKGDRRKPPAKPN